MAVVVNSVLFDVGSCSLDTTIFLEQLSGLHGYHFSWLNKIKKILEIRILVISDTFLEEIFQKYPDV